MTHPIAIVSLIILILYFKFKSIKFPSRFISISGDRWTYYDDANNGYENNSRTKRNDLVELDGRWRSTNPSILEEGFNKAEDLAHKVKELVFDQRRSSHDHSPEIR